ncbi:Prohibitin 1 (Fragments), partial [Lemmus lemmus]
DLQNVNITLLILFRPVATPLSGIDTSIGEDYDEQVLPFITTQMLKESDDLTERKFTEAVEAKQVAQKEVEEAEKAGSCEDIAYQLSTSPTCQRGVIAPPASQVRPPLLAPSQAN